MPTDVEAFYLSYWTDFYRVFSPDTYEDRPRLLMTLDPSQPSTVPQVELRSGSQTCLIRADVNLEQHRAGIELVVTDYDIYQADMLPNLHALNPFENYARVKTAESSASALERAGEYGLRFERPMAPADCTGATSKFGPFFHAQSVVWLEERIEWTAMGPYDGARPASLDSLTQALAHWVNIHAAEDIARRPDLVETLGKLLNIAPAEVLLALFDNPTHLIRALEQANQADYAHQVKELTALLWDDWCGILQTE